MTACLNEKRLEHRLKQVKIHATSFSTLEYIKHRKLITFF